MTYVFTESLSVQIPAQFDPKLVGKTLDELVAWEGRPPQFADEASLAVAIQYAKSAAIVERIRELVMHVPMLHVAFWRLLPAKQWRDTPPWPIVYSMALARGIDLKQNCARLPAELVHATDAEIAAIYAALKSKQTTEIKIEGSGIAERLVPLIANDAELVALWKKLQSTGTWRFMRSLSDAQVLRLVHERRANALQVSRARFEACRRGLFTREAFAAELALVAEAATRSRVTNLFALPAAGRGEDFTEAEHTQTLAEVGRALAPFVPVLAPWFVAHRNALVDLRTIASDQVMFVWGLCADADGVAWLASHCNADKDYVRKSANGFSKTLADSLVARSDGEAILAALGKQVKGKTLAKAIEKAIALLANRRVVTGASTEAIEWAHTSFDDAKRMLATFADPRAAVDVGIDSDDPIAVLNAFTVAAEVEFRRQRSGAEARATWPWEYVARVLRQLERRYTERVRGSKSTASQFTAGWNSLYWIDDGDLAARARFNAEVLFPLYETTKNARFKSWIEPTVLRFRPELAEATRDRLVRLAAACVAAGGETTTRTFVFRTAQRPSATTINRLFGPPIGVAPQRWPKHAGKPMVHLITLEASLLPAGGVTPGTAAVAVFVSSLMEHEAFAPGSAHAVVLSLAPEDIATGANVIARGDAERTGIALDIVTCDLPARAFQGGAKQGQLYELRRVLDRTDFLRPDQAPRWIQEPQPAGQFLFDLDEGFAPELNMGDVGRCFVFAETAFIQSN